MHACTRHVCPAIGQQAGQTRRLTDVVLPSCGGGWLLGQVDTAIQRKLIEEAANEQAAAKKGVSCVLHGVLVRKAAGVPSS